MSLKISLLFLLVVWNRVILSEPTDTETFDSAVTIAVRNLFGLNCITEMVINLEDAAAEFWYQINEKCGPSAAMDLHTELEDAKTLIKQTSKLVKINDNDCDNSAYDEELDAKRKPSYNCRNNYQKQMTQIISIKKRASDNIESALMESFSNSLCVKMALQNFRLSLENFVDLVSECKTVAQQR